MIEAQSSREDALAQLGVSRETAERLDAYVELLRRWQGVKNLVAQSTLDEVWHRHILDSGQLLPHLGSAKTIMDLGSGAGFPGLVLAILAMGRPSLGLRLVESNGRKAAFLAEAVRVTGAPATIAAMRIERAVAEAGEEVGLITARALAPLDQLLGMAEPLLKTGCQCLFLKGRDIEQELTEAAKSWRIQFDLIPSLTDRYGRILHVRRADRREK